MSGTIVNNRIAGTRITVWLVLHYLEGGWSRREIAELFELSEDQIQAAMDYIEANREYVMQVHREIEERIARGNPPEIEAKLVQTRAKMRVWLEERRRSRRTETVDARAARGR
jgi:uncharacterized protein (DUF433 family)